MRHHRVDWDNVLSKYPPVNDELQIEGCLRLLAALYIRCYKRGKTKEQREDHRAFINSRNFQYFCEAYQLAEDLAASKIIINNQEYEPIQQITQRCEEETRGKEQGTCATNLGFLRVLRRTEINFG